MQTYENLSLNSFVKFSSENIFEKQKQLFGAIFSILFIYLLEIHCIWIFKYLKIFYKKIALDNDQSHKENDILDFPKLKLSRI